MGHCNAVCNSEICKKCDWPFWEVCNSEICQKCDRPFWEKMEDVWVLIQMLVLQSFENSEMLHRCSNVSTAINNCDTKKWLISACRRGQQDYFGV